jgi:hypothetical protein
MVRSSKGRRGRGDTGGDGYLGWVVRIFLLHRNGKYSTRRVKLLILHTRVK